MKKTNLTASELNELKTKGMIVNKEFENSIKEMEYSNMKKTTKINNADSNKNNVHINFVHCSGQTYNDIINTVDILARMATAGTLKRIYATSAHEKIREYQAKLQADFNLTDNMNGENIAVNFSDAYDIYLIAYEFLYEKIVVLTLSPNDIITEILKNGNKKTRTVYQWTCVKVRQYIYNNKSIENNSKYTYIEDLKKSSDDTTENAIDREYIRVGKYHDIQNYHDYITVSEILEALDLSPQQTKIINLRMRGMSNIDIAKKFEVSKQSISNQLGKIQKKLIEKYPDLTRGFDFDKWN